VTTTGMPRVAPLYDKGAISYSDATFVAVMINGGNLNQLPDGLRKGDNPFSVIVLADYPKSDIGPYKEGVVLNLCETETGPGLFCSLIYVDSEVALCHGREVWGFPKKLAKIEISVKKDGKITAALSRQDTILVELKGNANQGMDVEDAGLSIGSMRIINWKYIPAVDGKGFDFSALTTVKLQPNFSSASTGHGQIHTDGEIKQVVGQPGEVEIIRASGNMYLPLGNIIKVFEPSDE
jgi:acetoacetate decarboxylase